MDVSSNTTSTKEESYTVPLEVNETFLQFGLTSTTHDFLPSLGWLMNVQFTVNCLTDEKFK